MIPRTAARSWTGALLAGRYAVRELVDETPSASVLHAEDTRVGRLVTIRVLRAGLGVTSSAGRRLQREARIAAAIGHPNVCEASDMGVLEDGAPFAVHERLVGETLDEAIRVQGALPISSSLDIALQVLSGLEASHARGIVHGALQPELVFLVRRLGCTPLVKICGFGEDLAAPPSERHGPAAHFLAPEQVRGRLPPDGRADIYACGAVLYEMLTGMRPFTAPDAPALLDEILGAPLRDPRTLRRDLPASLATIVLRAMEREAAARFPSALEMQRAIRAAQAEAETKGSYSLRTVLRTDEHAAVPPSRIRDAQATVPSWEDVTVEGALEETLTVVRQKEPPSIPLYGHGGEESVTKIADDGDRHS